MNDYDKLNNLNELADQMLGNIDYYSEHLLYQTDKFLDIERQIRPLIVSVRDPENRLPVSDEQRREVLERAMKLQVFFEHVRATKKKMDKLDEADDRQSTATVNNDAIAYEYMVKMKVAVADIKECSLTGRFSDGIDPVRLSKIFGGDITKSDLDLRTGYVGLMTNLFLGEERSPNRDKARQALKNGTIQQHLAIGVVDGKLGSRIEVKPVDSVKELIETKRVQEVIKRYQQAEEYWLGSDLSEAEERASRRAFMETYSDELNGLYQALNVDSVADAGNVRNDIIKLLNDNKISGMMRDYSNMMLDRDGNLAKQKPWSYLFTKAAGMNEAEIDFRAIPTENPVYDYRPDELNSAQKEGLKEFHKWIYRNCDTKGLGEAFGANGSARDYMEDFMKAPYETQIKTLYLLETKTRKNGPIPDENSEEFKNYVPNFKKIKDVMVSSKFKFWQRLNGKKHRWNKIKDCMDRITRNAKPGKSTAQPWTDGAMTGRTLANLVSGPANLINKTSDVAVGSTIAGDAFGAVQGAVAIVNTIKKIGDNPRRVGVDKVGMVSDVLQGTANIARSGASTYSKLASTGTELAANIGKHTGGGLNIYLTIRAAIGATILKYRNRRFNKGMEKVEKANRNKEFDQDSKDKLLDKIKRHGKALKRDNDAKALGKKIDIISSGANAAGYIATAALNISTAFPITLAVTSVAAPAIIAIKNKLAMRGIRKTIDAKLFGNAAEKEQALKAIRDNIDKRIKRIPNTKAFEGQRKALEKLKNDEGRLLHHIRKNHARKNGCVNEKQLKNLFIDRINKDADEMYNLENTAEMNDERQVNLVGLAKAGAEKLIELSGRKKPAAPQNQPAEEHVAENNQGNVRGINL